jgi:hypothetical protein
MNKSVNQVMDKIILIWWLGCESVIGFNLVACVTNTKNTLLISNRF